MKNAKNKNNEKGGSRNIVKKLWQCIWNSGGSICNCPGRPPSAQEIRDRYLEKCPWRQEGC